MLKRVPPLMMLATATPILVSAEWPVADDLAGTQWAQVIIQQRMVIRIPRADPTQRVREPYRPPPPPPRVVWREARAPKCVPAEAIVAAAMADGNVDLETLDGRRLRAKLGANCPTLTFYSGFYLKRTGDGLICAGRDALRSRSGAHCEIAEFRTLVPKR